ncbi:MAG: hypothetical protein R3324_19115 [Halobacteriales archaeon]|nr:hypothetical protein [Halobacteriales archaeon]
MSVNHGVTLGIVTTAAIVGGSWLFAGSWIVAGIVVGLAWLWVGGRERGSQRLANAVYGALVAVAAFGVLQDVMPGAMLVGSLVALASWDLDALARRRGEVEHVTERDRLQRRHFEHLSVVLIVGGVLGGAAMLGSVSLSLVGAIGLGAIAVVGLRWLLRTTARNLN